MSTSIRTNFSRLPLWMLALGLTVGFASVGCDVDVEDEGEIKLPEYEQTEEGNVELPDVDVNMPEVETGTTEVTVPTVDVNIPDEEDNEQPATQPKTEEQQTAPAE